MIEFDLTNKTEYKGILSYGFCIKSISCCLWSNVNPQLSSVSHSIKGPWKAEKFPVSPRHHAELTTSSTHQVGRSFVGQNYFNKVMIFVKICLAGQ